MTRLELSAILKALRFAGNSMTCDTAYTLELLMGLCPIRPSVYMESCLIRSAHKTFVGFDKQHKHLSEIAVESSCLALAFRTIIPPGWDSPAFVSNLSQALRFDGLKHSSNCAYELESAITVWKSRNYAQKSPKDDQKVVQRCPWGTFWGSSGERQQEHPAGVCRVLLLPVPKSHQTLQKKHPGCLL